MNDNILTGVREGIRRIREVFVGCDIEAAAMDLRGRKAILRTEHAGKLRAVGKSAAVSGIGAADTVAQEPRSRKQTSAPEIFAR